MDRASRNIGDKILVDIFKLKNRLSNINAATSMLTFVQTILVENHFVVMNLPSYVNFYNVQDAVKNPIPRAEGSTEFANTLFGTFLNVDYRDSSAKMVCFYGGKPSEQLDLKNNVDYRYRNDAFDLRRASDNPLIENQIGKKDWDKSNKVVGFNVDIGPQNQQIFVGFDVSQNAGQATAESLEIINQMANQNGNRGGSTQNVSLYNLYKNRSYTCQVTMMGNALIQPTMYFNLRYVPMFSGPYMILEVNHSITPGSFMTYFRGVRQPTASLPKIDNYLQSLRTNLLQSLIDKNEQDKKAKDGTTVVNGNTAAGQKTEVNNNATTNPANTTSANLDTACRPASTYSDYVNATPSKTKTTIKDMVNVIIAQTNDIKLQNTIFSAMYLATGVDQGFETNENNYGGITLKDGWGGSLSNYFYNKLYYCSSDNVPYAYFESLENNVKFLVSRWGQRMGDVTGVNKESITKFLILNSSATTLSSNVYTTYNSTELSNYESKVKVALDKFATQTGQVNPTVPPPTVSPLKDTYKYATTTPPIFENLKVEVDPTVDGLRDIFSIQYEYKITADCNSGSGYGQQFGINFVSANKQKFEIGLEDLLNESDCQGVSNAEQKGDYTYSISVMTKPVKADGSTDPSRNDFYKSYPISFKL